MALPRFKKGNRWKVPLLIVLIGAVTYLYWPAKLYSEVPGNISGYVQLSSEETHPFLFLGKLPPDNKKALKRAIAQFPDVRSCLVRSEKHKDRPNLLLLDWNAMHSEEAVEVCIFRIMSSIRNVRESRKWFEIQGFDETILSTSTISFSWKITRWSHGPRYPTNGLMRWWIYLISYRQSVAVTWDADQNIRDVNFTTYSL